MLSHMETDVAVEIVSSIRGNIFRYTQEFGKTPEIEKDIQTILAFKRRALRAKFVTTFDAKAVIINSPQRESLE